MEKTATGIFIPEKAQEAPNHGEVVAVGPGNEEHKVTLKVGDKVVLPAYGGTAIKAEKASEEEMMLYRETEILAKIVDA